MSHRQYQVLRSVLVGLAMLSGCGSKSSFDAQKAPYGDRKPTTVSHSVLTLGAQTSSGTTQLVGEKTVGGKTYSRVAFINDQDPSAGGEWWIDDTQPGSVTLIGWDQHAKLAMGLIPPGAVTLDQPATINLNAPLNVPQPAVGAASIVVPGDPTPHRAQGNAQYTLVEDNVAVETSMGKVYGCKHFTGTTTLSTDILPAIFNNQPLSGDAWYHPSYGVVAYNSPQIGLSMKMTDTSDCSDPDSNGFAIVRKVAIVDSAHPFKISTYDDCAGELDADKDEHAKMLLELRWADDAKAKAGGVETLGPMMRVEFGDLFGYFPASLEKSQVSIFHPEENGQGFNYSYGFVSQADKYMPKNGIEYHISVRLDSGASPIRATGRIYYKKYYANGAPPDAGRPIRKGTGGTPSVVGQGGATVLPGSGGARGGDGAADVGPADVPGLGGAGGRIAADAAVSPDVARGSGGAGGGLDGALVATTANLIVNGNAEQGVGSTDGTPVATPGWTVAGGATAFKYGVADGYPIATDPGPADRGLNFFCGGAADALSTLGQTISLAPYAASIDAGVAGFVLAGYLGGFAGQDDNATLSVSFRDTGGTELASTTIGPVNAIDRGSVTALVLRSATGKVPAGARSAIVTLTLTRVSGTANDGYADSLSLVLSGT